MQSLWAQVLVVVTLCWTLSVNAQQPVFTCDSLIPPPMCKLHVEQSYLQINNRSLFYVVYTPLNMEVDKTPVVILHGGPGVGHFGYEPLKAWACDGRKVVMYDQMGCGNSDTPVNISVTAPELLTVQYYVDELNQVIAQLGLGKVHLFGHSWGGMLAQEFAFVNQSVIKSLVLASTLASIEEYTSSISNNLIPLLPPLYQQVIAQGASNPGYNAAVNYFYSMFLTRINPWVDCMLTAAPKIGQEVYMGMNGPNEFTVTGTLKGWDIRSQLSKITVPTLVTRGEWDEVGMEVVQTILNGIKGSQYQESPLSAHMTFIDDSFNYIPLVYNFLQKNDD